ncbi:MAG: hypothetical protein C5B53_08395 [Candidatus Melainabacteria bacterium]|nr:MAG: hypothetical protein C5B53_08395 [Candidatus Melainabacteria bacterium]
MSSVKFVLILFLALMTIRPGLAVDETEEEFVPTEGALKGGTINSNQLLELGMVSPRSLVIEGEKALYSGDPDRAITVLHRSLDRDYEDADAHTFLARALEMKLKSQAERDPELYNECVKEWLVVLRNHSGMERGEGAHGINILGHLYEDEEHGVDARKHLVKLTGYAPKPWETSAKYLKRVLLPTSGTVSGAVVKDKSKEKSKDDK